MEIEGYEMRIRQDSDLLSGINNGDFFYFVHSYYCVPADDSTIIATTDYGVDLAASIFHFGEYTVLEVKDYLKKNGVHVRL